MSLPPRLASGMNHIHTKTEHAIRELERHMLTPAGIIGLVVAWVVLVMGLLIFVVDVWAFL